MGLILAYFGPLVGVGWGVTSKGIPDAEDRFRKNGCLMFWGQGQGSNAGRRG